MTEAASRRRGAAHRYAAYFAPAIGSAWWEAGSHWLGRCAARGQPLPQPAIDGMPPARQQALTAAPRRYGWHATLKAPFALPSHLDAAFAAVESFSVEEQARVAENLHFSCAMYDALLKSIAEATP